MATAAERAQRHRDRKRRGVVAVVPIEVQQEQIDTIVEFFALDADDVSPENLPGVAQLAFDEFVQDLRGED